MKSYDVEVNWNTIERHRTTIVVTAATESDAIAAATTKVRQSGAGRRDINATVTRSRKVVDVPLVTEAAVVASPMPEVGPGRRDHLLDVEVPDAS